MGSGKGAEHSWHPSLVCSLPCSSLEMGSGGPAPLCVPGGALLPGPSLPAPAHRACGPTEGHPEGSSVREEARAGRREARGQAPCPTPDISEMLQRLCLFSALFVSNSLGLRLTTAAPGGRQREHAAPKGSLEEGLGSSNCSKRGCDVTGSLTPPTPAPAHPHRSGVDFLRAEVR